VIEKRACDKINGFTSYHVHHDTARHTLLTNACEQGGDVYIYRRTNHTE